MSQKLKERKEQVLVSACCLGLHCRYHGRQSVIKKRIEKLKSRYYLVPVCPEQLGGLPTPRPSVQWNNGKLRFRTRLPRGWWRLTKESSAMFSSKGEAFHFFAHGAQEVLRIARCLHIEKAYLLKASPSCDPKEGLCAKLLKKNGITVLTL